MNAASIVVLAIIGVLAVLAVRRCLKRGMPCECGCCRGGHDEKDGGECCCCEKQD